MKAYKRPIYADHLECYVFAARHVANSHVLELGAGEGLGAQLLSPFLLTYIGVDVSQQYLNRAKNKQMHCPASFYVLDLEKELVPLEHREWVVAFEVLEHIDNPETVLKQIADSGKNVVFSVPHNYPHRLHKRDFYSLDDVRKIVPPELQVDWFALTEEGAILSYGDPCWSGDPKRYIGVGKSMV